MKNTIFRIGQETVAVLEDSYAKKLLVMAARGDLSRSPGVYVIEVVHDPWCAFLNDEGLCNCDPLIYPPRAVEEDAA